MNEHADVFLFAAGAFTAFAAVLNWSFFFEHRKARFLVRILGRSGARVFYLILGLVLIGAGIMLPG